MKAVQWIGQSKTTQKSFQFLLHNFIKSPIVVFSSLISNFCGSQALSFRKNHFFLYPTYLNSLLIEDILIKTWWSYSVISLPKKINQKLNQSSMNYLYLIVNLLTKKNIKSVIKRKNFLRFVFQRCEEDSVDFRRLFVNVKV